MKKILACVLVLGIAGQLCAKELGKIITVTNATAHEVWVLPGYDMMEPGKIKVFHIGLPPEPESISFCILTGRNNCFTIDAYSDTDSEKSFYTLIEKDGKLTAVGN